MNVSVSVSWLSVDHCVGGPVVLVPYHLCVKKRESSVLLNLHCKLNGWSYVVELGQESTIP